MNGILKYRWDLSDFEKKSQLEESFHYRLAVAYKFLTENEFT